MSRSAPIWGDSGPIAASEYPKPAKVAPNPTGRLPVTACDLCGTAITDLSGADRCQRCMSGVQWAGSDRAESGRAVGEVGDPVEDRRRVVAELRRSILDSLDHLPEVYALLPLFTEPGSTPPDPDGPRGKGSPKKAPVRLDVLDLLDEREKADSEAQRLDYDIDRRAGARRQGILPTLVSWLRLAEGEQYDQGMKPPELAETPTVATECAWLRGQLLWVVQQVWADELAADLEQMFADCRAATGWARPDPTLCPKCKSLVVARSGGAWWSCTGCPETWAREAEINRFMSEQEHVKTLRECAALVERPLGTLKEWRSRQWITPVATVRGVQMFDVRKVSEVSDRVVWGKSRRVS